MPALRSTVLVVKGQGHFKRLGDVLRCVVGSHRIGVLQQDGEFIAPHPRDHVVGRGQLLGQPPGNGLRRRSPNA